MIIALIFILLLLIIIFIRKRQMSILKRNGINGPEPNLITGNMLTFFNKSNVEKYQEYIRTYGKTCGYYVGKKPNIITIDVELIKRVQVKDFDKFSDRQNSGIKYDIHPNPKLYQNIISLKGSRWKEIRSILNPTFSAMKLKVMTPIIESAIDIFIEKVDNQAKKGNEFNIYDDFQLLTADVIAKTALGIDTNVQYAPNNEFFLAAKKIFDSKPNKFLLMFMCFPELDIILYPFRRFIEIINETIGNSPQITIARLIKTAIKLRKNKPIKTIDLLQLMLDAKVNENKIKDENITNLTIKMPADEITNDMMDDKLQTEKDVLPKKTKSLTEDEVIANAIIFYEAGYETTSTSLGFIAHFLVNKQDIQDKVRQEINELFEKEGKFDYNTVNKLLYMQCVINESIRYYPPVTSFITRNTNENFKYKGITIPKDATIKIPTYQLHHCEEYWPNHDVFDPDRFRDKKSYDPLVFQAFGNGPRNCIGMRFALYEIKLTLAKLLFKYKLVPGPSTEKELTIEAKIITETPKYGVFVKAIPI